MSKNNPASMADAAYNQLEVDARNQSYAVATEVTKNVITRYGSHEAPAVIKYWSDLADGVYAKMKTDIDAILKEK